MTGSHAGRLCLPIDDSRTMRRCSHQSVHDRLKAIRSASGKQAPIQIARTKENDHSRIVAAGTVHNDMTPLDADALSGQLDLSTSAPAPGELS